MLLFIKPNDIPVNQVIIPLERVYNIIHSSCRININYDSGELMEVAENVYQPKIDTASIVFDDTDSAEKVLRQFYKACNNHSGAFFFG